MQEINAKKSGHGGARARSGRKKTEGERHMYTIPADVARWINEHGYGVYITRIVREIMQQADK